MVIYMQICVSVDNKHITPMISMSPFLTIFFLERTTPPEEDWRTTTSTTPTTTCPLHSSLQTIITNCFFVKEEEHVAYLTTS